MADDVKPLAWWSNGKHSLSQLASGKPDDDPAVLTRDMVDDLRNSQYNDVREILEYKPQIARMLEPKEYRKNGARVTAKLAHSRQQQQSAFAAYIMLPKVNTTSCDQCQSKKSTGPCLHCIQPGPNYFRNACTNCQASSTASACSFYTGKKKRKATTVQITDDVDNDVHDDDDSQRGTKRVRGVLFDRFPQAMLENATSRQLELWRNQCEDELAERDAALISTSRKRVRR
ncbi:hypothetical protein F5X99DRAFT_274816 [Biscogniauxia marginata]|nr:hypothetical protein F5X99DRAFT_274816 [Biscogniauxia marginata]